MRPVNSFLHVVDAVVGHPVGRIEGVSNRAASDSTAQTVSRLRAAGCVFAELEAEVMEQSARDSGELERMLSARELGEPLEHIVGWVEFAGRRLVVRPGVFVPRQRTVFLAETADRAVAELEHRRRGHGTGPGTPITLVEMCAGIAPVATVIASAHPRAEVHAADIDARAVDCARDNLVPAGGAAHLGDLFAALPARLRGRVHVIVANAPYVPAAAVDFMPVEARDHEPSITWDGGVDGLAVQRRLLEGCTPWLAPSAVVMFETSEELASHTHAVMASAGFAAEVLRDDERDATVVVGRLGQRVVRPPR